MTLSGCGPLGGGQRPETHEGRESKNKSGKRAPPRHGGDQNENRAPSRTSRGVSMASAAPYAARPENVDAEGFL